MTLRQADTYTDLHPAEAWRFAKAHGRSTIKQTTVLKLRNYLLNRKPLNLSNLIPLTPLLSGVFFLFLAENFFALDFNTKESLFKRLLTISTHCVKLLIRKEGLL